jgi:hypothetical protein
MNNHERQSPQFESVSIQIRISMMKLTDTHRKNRSQDIQSRQEEKLISMMNNKKVHVLQFASISIQIRM